MPTPEPENPFRTSDNPNRKFKVRSNPSIEFEPHMRATEETIETSDHGSVWREPTLAGGGYHRGHGRDHPDSNRQMYSIIIGLLAVVVILGLIRALFA